MLPSRKKMNLNAGYVLTSDGYSIKDIFLTRPKTKYENSWILNMGDFVDNDLIIPEPRIVTAIAQSSSIKVAVKESAKEVIKKKNVSNE
ncbi:MAG: hypothetical protein D3917_20605 [Candidatus Electrothrix sp. AX5]|nr:hypothetical protein [Candidatus Electrothrix sp. AX5]